MNTDINAHILALIEKSPDAIVEGIAQRVKLRRLEMNLTQKTLAARAGISYSTYRRFEAGGDISLKNLVMIALVLDARGEFKQLFSQRRYESFDDALQKKASPARKRGRRND